MDTPVQDLKRIIITGAAGFLGSHLCDRFIREGYHVIGMDNLITGSLRNIEHLFKLPNFEFYQHDVSKLLLPRKCTEIPWYLHSLKIIGEMSTWSVLEGSMTAEGIEIGGPEKNRHLLPIFGIG